MENKLFNDYLDNTVDRAIKYGHSSTYSLDDAIEEYLWGNWDIINEALIELKKYTDNINELSKENPDKIIDNGGTTVGDLMSDSDIDFVIEVLKLGFKIGYEESQK